METVHTNCRHVHAGLESTAEGLVWPPWHDVSLPVAFPLEIDPVDVFKREDETTTCLLVRHQASRYSTLLG